MVVSVDDDDVPLGALEVELVDDELGLVVLEAEEPVPDVLGDMLELDELGDVLELDELGDVLELGVLLDELELGLDVLLVVSVVLDDDEDDGGSGGVVVVVLLLELAGGAAGVTVVLLVSLRSQAATPNSIATASALDNILEFIVRLLSVLAWDGPRKGECPDLSTRSARKFGAIRCACGNALPGLRPAGARELPRGAAHKTRRALAPGAAAKFSGAL